jgi:hypothetical protein
LHVLSAPPAFVLSQDQTLSFILVPDQDRPEPATALACATDSASSNRPGRGPHGITSRLPEPGRIQKIRPNPEKHSKASTGPRTGKTRPRPSPPARNPDPETRLNPRCAKPTAQPPPTHPFLSQLVQRADTAPRAELSPPCLASGRGFIVIARGGHKSFFRQFDLLTLIFRSSLQS